MFVDSRGGYTKDGGQWAKGPFLIVVDHPTERFEYKGKTYARLYGLIRKIHMEQLGQFMMACTKIQGVEIVLSGGFGNDGLPVCYSKVAHVMHMFKPIDDEIAGKYWTEDDGWNSVGCTARLFRQWARENFKF